MPGMSGLALFDQLAERGLVEAMPVIFLTGHADVPTAVDMVKRGAFDFCEKPFSDNALVDRIEHALGASLRALAAQRARRPAARARGRTDRARARRDAAVVEGLPNKLIADQLVDQRAHGGSAPGARVREDGSEVGGGAGQPAAGSAIRSALRRRSPTKISTRRFCARPASLLLSAIGSREPGLRCGRRCGGTPRAIR